MKKRQMQQFFSKNLEAILRNVNNYSSRVISEIERELKDKVTEVEEVPDGIFFQLKKENLDQS